MDYTVFPAINATLNGTSALLLIIGRTMIARGRVAAHRAMMISAFTTSTLFLVCYLTYHIGRQLSGLSASVHFQGTGWSRPIYFTILISHTILAVIIVPLVLITLNRGLKQRYPQHRKIARWTFPLWLYVSVTGVVIYVMLYHLFA